MLLTVMLAGCLVDQRMGQRCADDDAVCIASYTQREPPMDAAAATDDGARDAISTCRCDGGALGSGNGSSCEGCVDASASDRCFAAGHFTMQWRVDYQSMASSVCGIVPLDPMLFESSLIMRLQERSREGLESRVTGCLEAVAAGPDDIGWRGAIDGRLDCTTGKLTADIRTSYNVVSICTLGLFRTRFYAKGKFDGLFERGGGAAGEIVMREPKTLSGQLSGGSGTWSASWEGGVEGPFIELEDCLGVPFPEQTFLDAGL